MLRPFATAGIPTRSNSSRAAALVSTGIIQVALLTAILGGFAPKIVQAIPDALSVVDLSPPEPKTETPPPPPSPEMVQPAMPTVALPVINIARPADHAITAVAVPKPVAAAPRPVAPTIAVPAPAPAPIPATALKSVTATHTTPPYPDIARRMGEQGQVKLHIAVDANGIVTEVRVTSSSGHDRLDRAAVDWVQTHWRYHAATRNGTPIASSTEALVVFDLKTAR